MDMRKKAMMLFGLFCEVIAIGGAFFIYWSGGRIPSCPLWLRQMCFCILLYMAGWLAGVISQWWKNY